MSETKFAERIAYRRVNGNALLDDAQPCSRNEPLLRSLQNLADNCRRRMGDTEVKVCAFSLH